jgi:hypothetical protein
MLHNSRFCMIKITRNIIFVIKSFIIYRLVSFLWLQHLWNTKLHTYPPVHFNYFSTISQLFQT